LQEDFKCDAIFWSEKSVLVEIFFLRNSTDVAACWKKEKLGTTLESIFNVSTFLCLTNTGQVISDCCDCQRDFALQMKEHMLCFTLRLNLFSIKIVFGRSSGKWSFPRAVQTGGVPRKQNCRSLSPFQKLVSDSKS
jgi:hypothetical protein